MNLLRMNSKFYIKNETRIIFQKDNIFRKSISDLQSDNKVYLK